MALHIRCGRCATRFEVPNNREGERVKCPSCTSRVVAVRPKKPPREIEEVDEIEEIEEIEDDDRPKKKQPQAPPVKFERDDRLTSARIWLADTGRFKHNLGMCVRCGERATAETTMTHKEYYSSDLAWDGARVDTYKVYKVFVPLCAEHRRAFDADVLYAFAPGIVAFLLAAAGGILCFTRRTPTVGIWLLSFGAFFALLAGLGLVYAHSLVPRLVDYSKGMITLKGVSKAFAKAMKKKQGY